MMNGYFALGYFASFDVWPIFPSRFVITILVWASMIFWYMPMIIILYVMTIMLGCLLYEIFWVWMIWMFIYIQMHVSFFIYLLLFTFININSLNIILLERLVKISVWYPHIGHDYQILGCDKESIWMIWLL